MPLLAVEAGMEVGGAGIGLLLRIVAGGEGMIEAARVEWQSHLKMPAAIAGFAATLRGAGF